MTIARHCNTRARPSPAELPRFRRTTDRGQGKPPSISDMSMQVQPVCDPPLAPEPLDISLVADTLSSLVPTFDRNGDRQFDPLALVAVDPGAPCARATACRD
jgi:hypothetical protein